MFRVRGLVCIVFLLALLIGGSTLCEIEAWAEGISYRGMSKCEGLQLEVSFTYDSAASTIKDFTSLDSHAR